MLPQSLVNYVHMNEEGGLIIEVVLISYVKCQEMNR